MRARHYVAAGVAILLAVVLAAILRPHDSGQGGRTAQEPAGEAEGERAGSGEVQEEQEVTAERLEALAEAKASGKFGAKVAATTRPATGWVGSRVMSSSFDDWEPAVAHRSCRAVRLPLDDSLRDGAARLFRPLPLPIHRDSHLFERRLDLGRAGPVCLCLGSKAQYDPTIEVVPNTGAVYSVFLNADRHNGFSTVFTKSTDHGATWTDPVHVYGNVSWTDKPEIATSASGKDIYVSWNGPQGGDLYVGQSHDFGATWTQQKLSDDKRYYYAYDARVLSDGTVVFSESSIVYSGLKKVDGEVWHHAIISRDKGRDLGERHCGQGAGRRGCVADGCKPDFYIGQTSVVSDAPGHLVFTYEGPTTAGGPQRVYVATSSDAGRTWSAGAPVSVSGENATGPRLASSGGGNVAHLVHADRRRRRPRRVERLVPELDERRRGPGRRP